MIVEKLLDLQKQATTEQSHYYVASCVTEAIQEIVTLRTCVAAVESWATRNVNCNHSMCSMAEAGYEELFGKQVLDIIKVHIAK